MVTIDPIPVVLGVIGYLVLGFLWYGPMFGSIWMDAMGFGADEGPEDASTLGYLLTTVGALVAVLALAVLIDWTNATTWSEGLLIGAIAGVGFVATTGLQAIPFENQHPRVYILNVGYNVLALVAIGALLAVW